MADEEVIREPGAGAGSACLPAGVFYGLIVAGVILGMSACAAGGWLDLKYGDAKPAGRRIWDGIADQFLVPVCVMIGATFGGLLGVALAITCDRQARKRHRR